MSLGIAFRAIFENDEKSTANQNQDIEISSDRARRELIFHMRHRTISLAGVNAFILIVRYCYRSWCERPLKGHSTDFHINLY